MTRDAVHATSAPAAVGPYSHAVREGDMIFLSGQAPLDPGTGAVVEGGVEAQTRQVLANLEAVLSAAGASFEDVVKANIYLTDLGDFATVNALYAECFTEPYPARTTIGVAGLPLGIAVEIELVARVPR
ncbi:RidA family protein [Ornithinimicrobium sp. W1665]|uniref:RidA family protein n=1 Tax=Ornithinimicrobium sp. W1665 TaxID=3416666 RepID=UPI003CFB11F9